MENVTELELPPYLIPLDRLAQNKNRFVLTAEVIQPAPIAVRDCVVKLLLEKDPSEEVDSFINEYLRLQALHHPNWIRPLFFGWTKQGCYLLLEQSRGKLLSSYTPVRWGPSTLSICHGILSGLSALHAVHQAHLDLNLEQILVSPLDDAEDTGSLAVSLLDLGLSATFGTALPPSGTPGYIAPEMFVATSGGNWDGRADLYSFGALLFELLDGTPAFVGRDGAELIRSQLAGFDDSRIRDHHEWPKGLQILLGELLETDPERRPLDATEVWQRLRDLLPPVSATQLPPTLSGSTEPTFIGRDDECQAFSEWLTNCEGQSITCRVVGEAGIGKSRTIERFSAMASTSGWTLETAPGEGSRLLSSGSRSLKLIEEVSRATEPFRREELPVPGSRDAEADSLVVRLRTPSSKALASIAASMGIASPNVTNHVIRLSSGNPALLVSLIARLREQTAIAADLSTAEIEGILEANPPPSWIAWTRALLEDFSPGERTELVVCAMAPPDEPVRDFATSVLDQAVSDPVLMFLEHKGLLREPAETFASPLWAATIQLAGVETARHLVPNLERWIGGRISEVSTTALAKVARASIRIGAPSAIASLSAWRSQLARGLLEQATNLALDLLATEERLGKEVLSPAERSEVLRETMVAGAMVSRQAARRMPLSMATSVPRFETEAATWILFRAWILDSWSKRSEAAGLLRSIGKPQDEALRFVWYILGAGALQAMQDSPVELISLLDRLDSDPFDDPDLDANLRIRMASPRLGAAAAAQLDRIRPRLASLSKNNQASFWMNDGLRLFHSGRYDAAFAAIAQALQIYEELDLRVLADKARQNLSALFFASGELPRAAETLRAMYSDALRRGAWHRCADALVSVTLLAVMRGHLGAGRRSARQLRSLAPRVGKRENEQDIRSVEATVALHLGALSSVESILGSEWTENDGMYGKARSLLGQALLLQGDADGGRAAAREGLDSTRERGLLDDAAELLVSWLLCEIDTGGRDQALRLLNEFDEYEPHCSVPTRTLLILAESEMAALDWLDTSGVEGGASALLDTALAELERCDLGYYCWRPAWRKGQVLLRLGDYEAAAHELDRAREELLRLSRSAESPRLTESLLSLPAPAALIDDIEAVRT